MENPPKRIVLLIDIHFNNSNNYISRILTSLHKLLNYPPLSKSLFAFKLFVSSLSPIHSSSKLNSPRHLSFHYPSQTLTSLSQTLTSLNLESLKIEKNESCPHFIPKFLLQLLHEYSWDESESERSNLASNLVMLFSPCLNLGERLDFDGVLKLFGPVKEKFENRGIFVNWVGVDCEGKCDFLERGIRKLGWGFCWADAIVVGSAFVPFGLIFNHIRYGVKDFLDESLVKCRAELVLEIADVSGKSLECKSSNFEAIELKPFLNNFNKDVMKIRVKEVWRRDVCGNVKVNSAGMMLICGISSEYRKKQSVENSEFIVEKVLNMLCVEKDECVVGEPFWLILLSFLYRRNYWASVSIILGDVNSFEGILKPFTVNYALVSIVEKELLNSYKFASKIASDRFDILAVDTSKTKDGRRERNSMKKKLLQEVTWSSFYEVAFTQDGGCAREMDLEEVYFSDEINKSKKLRFLKCWMRQMKKSVDCCHIKPNDQEEPPNLYDEAKVKIESSEQELDMNATSSPIKLEPFDKEALLRTIPEKIEHGICSNEIDLWNLAQRLVRLSINAIYSNFGSNASCESVPYKVDNACVVDAASEISHVLLIKPKDLMLKYKISDSAHAPSDQCSANYSAENIIRAHELQILFRMELLRSSIIIRIEENAKQKMVKEICSLLQNIEFHLQGDFLCGESLLEFAERSIKTRYAHSLIDVIHKIYEQMEFFSFNGNNMEASDSFHNSSCGEHNRDINDNDSASSNNVEKDAHDESLMNARYKRDRARRFSSFTSWAPDLHRVWALKQPSLEKPMFDSVMNKSKPNKRMKRARSRSEVVCETPMTGEKLHDESSGDKSCKSLSKALFQTEGDN